MIVVHTFVKRKTTLQNHALLCDVRKRSGILHKRHCLRITQSMMPVEKRRFNVFVPVVSQRCAEFFSFVKFLCCTETKNCNGNILIARKQRILTKQKVVVIVIHAPIIVGVVSVENQAVFCG